jgi:hypothetical protein
MKGSILEKLTVMRAIDNDVRLIMKRVEKSNKKIDLYQDLIDKLKKNKISTKEYKKEFERIKKM